MVFPYQRKPRLCVLTYKALTGLVLSSEGRFRDRAEIVIDEYGLDDAMLRGRQLQQQGEVDVVVSAGYNVALLRSQLDLPVASIDVTGFDLLQALKTARSMAPQVGLVVYSGAISELEPVRDLLNVELELLTYESPTEARDCMLQLKSRGIEVVVGSSLIVGLAEQLGMRGVLFYTASSIDRALEKAIEIGENAIRQSARFEHLNAVMAHLHEAILAVDMRHRITAINPSMRQILDCGEAEPIGQRLPDIATELSLAGVIDGQPDEAEVVVQLRRGTYLMSRTAIRERGLNTGALLTLRETAAIQRADSTIRSQRRSRNVTARYSFDLITGTSAALTYARSVAERCARTASTVLISGETGTGKELFAQAIHNASARRLGPFVAMNCASFPESLLESELFGYEEGSFTGSRKGGKPGLFEAAHTGTIFLDEIGDMPISLQTRLLRVLQEREVVRLGSNAPVSIDVRVIAATHRSLEDRISAGSFRADLYYRINILQIALPPLRDRAEDLPLLADQLLAAKLREVGSALRTEHALAPLLPLLSAYAWPGNIRELENLMERFAVFLFSVKELSAIDYALFLREAPELTRLPSSVLPDPQLESQLVSESVAQELGIEHDDATVRLALQRSRGNRQAAAQLLGISRTTLWRRLRDMPELDEVG